jgi:long-chain fatty acid transport protein
VDPASANPTQDQLGFGARAKSMGGAGTAIATDNSATYYNPAGLSHCEENQLALEVAHLAYGLDTESPGDVAAPVDPKDRTAVTVGSCHHLPHRLSLGFAFDTGVQRALRLDQSSLSDTPVFAMYGAQLETVTLMAALSYRLSDKLSVGLGGSVLANSNLGVGITVPVIGNEQELAADIVWDFDPTAALHAGVVYQVTSELRLGAALRTPLYHKLEGEVTTTVDVAGVLLDVDLLIESVAWYSPLQAAIGAAYALGDRALVAADLTWYRWSAYPGPALRISPLDPNDTIAAGLNYPPEEKANFKDIVVPRLGAEIMVSEKMAVRSGLSYRVSPAPLPTEMQRANLVDSNVAALTLGGGYSWTLGDATKTRNATSGHVDFHLRLQHMQEKSVDKLLEDNSMLEYRFGGQLYDAGLTLTLGW